MPSYEEIQGSSREPDLGNTNHSVIFRLKGTVILRIWWQLILVCVYSGIIAYIHIQTSQSWALPESLLSMLGLVVGLLLTFRTQTAYERYSQGRDLWSNVTMNLRNLTRYITVDVKNHSVKSQIEKKSAINLLKAFPIATKHYLRDEYSYEYEDLKDLIKNITPFDTPSSNVPLKIQKSFGWRKYYQEHHQRVEAYDEITPTNIPIELSYYIESYINYCQKNELISSDIVGAMRAALANLVQCLTTFERIQRTPIPLAYSVHLSHMTWLYILTLPYQLVDKLGWYMIPVVGICTFSLLGILQIGWEIENPFGYDANDLPLDDFCKVIQLEIQRVQRKSPDSAETWIYSDRNAPFLPKSGLTANELLDLTEEQLQELQTTDKIISEVNE